MENEAGSDGTVAIDPQQQQRSRTFSWVDPSIGLLSLKNLSGLDYLRGVAERRLPAPPVVAALGFDKIPQIVEPGSMTFFFEPEEYQYNSVGSVHGGIISTLLDTAMGCAVHTKLAAGVLYTTLTLNVSFLRAVTLRIGRLSCTATVTSAGRKVATAEARLRDARDRLYAQATATCLILGTEPTQNSIE